MPGSNDTMSISTKPALVDRLFFSRRAGRTAQRRAPLQSLGTVEGLEPRWLPSVATPAIQMLSATTTDSKSVTIEYQVNQAPTTATPLQFGVYRSSDGQFNSSDSEVDTVTLVPPGSSTTPTLDSSGQPATAIGTHQLTISLPGGLPPYPEKPYVLVVADPSSSSATTESDQTASFRVYTIGVVTHGGIQDPSWTHGPPWELETAYMMKHEGFDSVIPYNWALLSSTPGEAIKQSPRLAADILHAASKFPASAVVDLELVGHSEGTVVNTYALVKVASEMPANLKAGYIEDTLLDPHAANNNIVTGKQMSFNGVLAPLADLIVTDYQGEANDPPPYFPSVVDQANVFFEHTSSSAGAIYNLWGQVPVKSDGPVVHYYNLTGMGVTHSGKTGVNYWFRDFIAPTLGDGAPLISALQLNGQIDNAQSPSATTSASAGPEALAHQADLAHANHVYGPEQIVTSNQPEFSGTAAPNSVVKLFLSPATKPQDIAPAGITQANSSGQWTLTTRRPLPNGQYRTVVTGFSRALRTRPGLAIVPTQPLGRLVVDGSS
jgi:hypothetical protein